MQTDIFWKTALPVVIVLIVGIWIGIAIDTGRVDELRERLTESDILFNDVRMHTMYYDLLDGTGNVSEELCNAAFAANLEYNNRIYQQGILLERYEVANKLISGLIAERRQYALQQLQFWANALRIRKLCNADYDVILHLWKYDTKNDSSIEIPQKLQSAVLLDLKERCGHGLMLSNAPTDLNLTSTDMIVRMYNITEMPALIINNGVVLEGFKNLEELGRYVNC